MKIVIDRDKEVNKLKEMIDTLTDKKDLQSVRFAINILENIEGTPLPKGHGDLVDRNDLLEYTDINRCAYTPTINRYDIITAPTIIEADKESDNE